LFERIPSFLYQKTENNAFMSESPKIAGMAGFWQDTADCWRQLPNKFFFFGLLAAWLALFQFLGNSTLGYIHSDSLFSWLYTLYNNPNPANDSGYGNLIPFIVIGLFWWKRRTLLALPLRIWWPGLLMVAAAALLHFGAYVIQQPKLSVVALILGIYGLTGLAWGPAWLKEGVFPFWLFVFSVPIGFITMPLAFPLRILSSWLTATVAHLLTINVVREGTQLMSADGSYQYDVAAACSGLHSLVAIFLLATIYGFVAFRSPGKRAVLMLLAVPLSVLGNFTRLMCIIIAAEFGGQSAGNFVHENTFFSLLPYVPAMAGLLWAGHLLDKKRGQPQPPPAALMSTAPTETK
jgi:exosortase